MTNIKTIRVSTIQKPARSTIQDSSPITLAWAFPLKNKARAIIDRKFFIAF
jgi:hypothetical protein